MGRHCGKPLLMLDTVTGGDAERLYARPRRERVGEILGYALLPLNHLSPDIVFVLEDARELADGDESGGRHGGSWWVNPSGLNGVLR